MKKVSFRVRNFDKEQFLTYNIDNEALLDEDVLDFLEEDEPKGLVPVIFEEGEEFDTFSYDITDKIHICELSGQEIGAEMVLKVMRGLVLALMDMSEYRVPLYYLVLNRNYIYINSDYEVEFICVPLEEMQEEVDLNGFLRSFLANLRFESSENGDYVAKLLSYINNTAIFNLRNFATLIEDLMDERGIEIPEDSATDIYVDYQEVVDDEDADNSIEEADESVLADLEDADSEEEYDEDSDEDLDEEYDEDSDEDLDEEYDEDSDEDLDEEYDEDSDENLDEEYDEDSDEDLDEEYDEDSDEDLDEEYDEDSDEDLDEEYDEDSDEDLDEEYDEDSDEDLDKEYDEDSDEDLDKEYDEDSDEDLDKEYDEDSDEDSDKVEAEPVVEDVKEETVAPVAEEVKEETAAPVAEEAKEETATSAEEAKEETAAPVAEEAKEETAAPVAEEAKEETAAPVAEEAKEETTASVTENAKQEATTPAEETANKVIDDPELQNMIDGLKLVVEQEKGTEKPRKKTRIKTKSTIDVGGIGDKDFDEFLASRELGLKQPHHQVNVKQKIKVNRASIVKSNQEEAEAKAAEEAAKKAAEEAAKKAEEEARIAEEETKKAESEEDKSEETETSITSSIAAVASSILAAADAVPKANPYLIRVNTEERIMITKQTFKVGKATIGVDYSVRGNNAISRVHAIITGKDEAYYVRDNKSTNHTIVNGKVLEEGENELLTDDCKIVLGDEEFIFKLR